MSDRFLPAAHDPRQMPVDKLAFLGDAVYELLIRELLLEQSGLPFDQLNEQKQRMANAAAQSQAAERLLPLLSDEERAVYTRGRNAGHKYIPKNATPGQYGRATGLECLFGYLYLCAASERITALFNAIIRPTTGGNGDGTCTDAQS